MNCLITQKVTLFFECLAIPVFYSVAAQFVTAQLKKNSEFIPEN
jgi:hypothetical protein